MQLKNYAYRFINGKFEEIIFAGKQQDVLLSIDENIKLVDSNVKFFIKHGFALNMLFWGEKGSGKSTLLRQMALKYADSGLVTIEVLDYSNTAIYELYKTARENCDKRLLLYIDDISFDDTSEFYRQFKSSIEGGLEEKPQNIIFTITSNKRHIMSDRALDTSDIYARDDVNERTSLEARFGIVVRFGIISKVEYLEIVEMYLKKYNVCYNEDWQRLAENYAIDRGGRSGRLAKQFAIYSAIVSEGE